MINKDHILSDIRRIASENSGSPPGKRRFETETGTSLERGADKAGRYYAILDPSEIAPQD
jgi:hypothetical protein